jgi:hypothetical protein
MASTYWQAGWKLTAARLNSWTDRVRPARYSSSLSGPMSGLGSWTVCPGTSQTIVTTTAGAIANAFATWEYEPGSVMFGKVYVDGVAAAPQAVISSKGVVGINVPITFATAGTHTVDIRALVSGSAGTLYTSGTQLLTLVYEAV